jgi:hypothetical protein
MFRSVLPLLFVPFLLGGCAKPVGPGCPVGDLEERVRGSEKQLAIARAEVARLHEQVL